MKFFLKQQKGFTIVEIITVLFVISLGLVGVLSIIVQNISSQSFNKTGIIAYQLAQEGIELVRHTRDTNFKELSDFDDGLAPGSYFMDYLDEVPTLVSDPVLDIKLKQDNNGMYYHDRNSSDPDSGFSREIIITTKDDNSIYVLVVVSWPDHNLSRSYNLETMLYDWR